MAVTERRLGVVRVINTASRYALLERADTWDGVLCPFAAIEGDHRLLRVGQRVIFTPAMAHNGRHLAKDAKLLR